VAVNDNWEASFTYNDPTLEVCQGESKQFVLFSVIRIQCLIVVCRVRFFTLGVCV